MDFQVEASDINNAVRGAIIEDSVLARVRQQGFWKEVDARLRDEKERRVVYGSFVLASSLESFAPSFRKRSVT
jgi:hypothetical protein